MIFTDEICIQILMVSIQHDFPEYLVIDFWAKLFACYLEILSTLPQLKFFIIIFMKSSQITAKKVPQKLTSSLTFPLNYRVKNFH
jgi:hypothetical protein